MITTGTLSSADGSSMVRIGNTTVVCGIKMEVGRPQETAPKEGRLTVSVQLTPVCSPDFSVGKASDDSIRLSEFLSNTITSTKVIHLDELCIVEKMSSWVLYADIVCLDYDGNVVDASLLALVSALKNLKLPETKNGDDGEVFIVEGGEGRALTVRHHPVPLTFCLLDEFCLVDPSADEEDLMSATCTFVYNEKNQLCAAYKPGGAALSLSQQEHCMKLAKKRAKELALQL